MLQISYLLEQSSHSHLVKKKCPSSVEWKRSLMCHQVRGKVLILEHHESRVDYFSSCEKNYNRSLFKLTVCSIFRKHFKQKTYQKLFENRTVSQISRKNPKLLRLYCKPNTYIRASFNFRLISRLFFFNSFRTFFHSSFLCSWASLLMRKKKLKFEIGKACLIA